MTSRYLPTALRLSSLDLSLTFYNNVTTSLNRLRIHCVIRPNYAVRFIVNFETPLQTLTPDLLARDADLHTVTHTSVCVFAAGIIHGSVATFSDLGTSHSANAVG